jgi:hypothetical protein
VRLKRAYRRSASSKRWFRDWWKQGHLHKIRTKSLSVILLRPRPEYGYVIPSHRTALLRSSKACSIISVNLRSIELIDSAIMLRFSASESRNEQEISARKFYWTIHEESHFVIFISRHENDSDTNRVRHRSCSSRKS